MSEGWRSLIATVHDASRADCREPLIACVIIILPGSTVAKALTAMTTAGTVAPSATWLQTAG